ncbi:MAG TPA: hypothetical protein VHN98_11060 [Acidimicrobiales bacterium]|nr:hypothetical protein [Acidimicrobiales bacterium]
MAVGRSRARDWVAWHEPYADPASNLSRRLAAVQALLREALDAMPAGAIRVLSACAGQGHDVLGVLPTHPRRGDVTALLVESDPTNAAAARAHAADAGVAGQVTVAEADAGTTDPYRDAAPAHVLLFCGVYGNVTDGDIARTILETRTLAAAGAWVLWTRGRGVDDDVTPSIRRWYDAAGFIEHAFVAPGDASFSVGCNRLAAAPRPYVEGVRLFTFV